MPSENLTQAVDRLSDIAQMIFAVPVSSQLAAVWTAGFITPMICYIAAYAIGALVNMWRR